MEIQIIEFEGIGLHRNNFALLAKINGEKLVYFKYMRIKHPKDGTMIKFKAYCGRDELTKDDLQFTENQIINEAKKQGILCQIDKYQLSMW